MLPGIGLVARVMGRKLSSKTLTKFEGNRPIARRSLCSLPIHQDPSPAFKHSIRSPSTNPRSFFVSPPQEYTARHQHGKRMGRFGATAAILKMDCTLRAHLRTVRNRCEYSLARGSLGKEVARFLQINWVLLPASRFVKTRKTPA